MAQCQTWDKWVASMRLTEGTVLCPWPRHFIICLALVQLRKAGKCPNIAEKLLTET